MASKILSKLRTRLRRFSVLHKRALFVLITTVLFFALAEGAVRFSNTVGRPGPDAPGVSHNPESSSISDPYLFWRFVPGSEMEGDGRIYRINSRSLRDHEIALPKPPGVFRILSLGESTTFGAGVALEETYTKVAERLLRERLPEMKIEAINAGVGAYTSFQCVTYLERYGLDLMPDMVWLFSQTNDTMASYMRNYANLKHGFGYTDRELYEIRTRHAGLISLFNRSDLYKLLRQWITGRQLASYRAHVAGKEEELKSGNLWRPRVPLKDRKANLLRYVEIARKNKITPVFLLPAYYTSKPGQTDIMSNVADRTGALLVDLPDYLYNSGRFNECWFSMDELGGHPNAVGHRLMGEAIAEALAPALKRISE